MRHDEQISHYNYKGSKRLNACKEVLALTTKGKTGHIIANKRHVFRFLSPLQQSFIIKNAIREYRHSTVRAATTTKMMRAFLAFLLFSIASGKVLRGPVPIQAGTFLRVEGMLCIRRSYRQLANCSR